MSEEKQINMKEVAKHNTADDCWLIIGNDKTGTCFCLLQPERRARA